MVEDKSNNNKREDNKDIINQNSQEILTNSIYTPAFLKTQIGKLMNIEFLIGTNNIVDKIGILQDVGVNYILLRSLESDNITYCYIYSIKFITILQNQSNTYGSINSRYRYY